MPHRVNLFLTNSVSYVLSPMRGKGRGGSKTVVNKYAKFLSLTFSKVFTRQGITLVKVNGAELKLKGRTMNINQFIFGNKMNHTSESTSALKCR